MYVNRFIKQLRTFELFLVYKIPPTWRNLIYTDLSIEQPRIEYCFVYRPDELSQNQLNSNSVNMKQLNALCENASNSPENMTRIERFEYVISSYRALLNCYRDRLFSLEERSWKKDRLWTFGNSMTIAKVGNC